MLLGRYDALAIDCWLRRTVGDAWFGGRTPTDREIVQAFERFRPYRALAYHFYDWQGADRRELWAEPEPGRALTAENAEDAERDGAR